MGQNTLARWEVWVEQGVWWLGSGWTGRMGLHDHGMDKVCKCGLGGP